MKCKLITQISKPYDYGIGYLDVDIEGNALFIVDMIIKTGMERVRLESINKSGIRLNGMEPDGYDKKGIKKFKYQEWYIVPFGEEN